MSAQRKPPRTAANFNMQHTSAEFYAPRTAANFNMPHSHAARTAAVFRANQMMAHERPFQRAPHTATSFIPTASEMDRPFRYSAAPKTSCEFDYYNPNIGNSDMAYTGTQFDVQRGAPRTGSLLWMDNPLFGGYHPGRGNHMSNIAESTMKATAMGAALAGGSSLAFDAGRYAMHSMRSNANGNDMRQSL